MWIFESNCISFTYSDSILFLALPIQERKPQWRRENIALLPNLPFIRSAPDKRVSERQTRQTVYRLPLFGDQHHLHHQGNLIAPTMDMGLVSEILELINYLTRLSARGKKLSNSVAVKTSSHMPCCEGGFRERTRN